MKKIIFASITAAALFSATATAQQPAAPAPAPAPAIAPGYGLTISLEKAKKVVAAAQEEAKKNNWLMAISIVEPNGTLIYYEKADGTQYASVEISQWKAKTSAAFRRPSKAMADLMQTPAGSYYATFPMPVTASPGGIPIVEGGRIIGAIGVSGATGAQDHQVAEAGVAVIK